MTSIATSHVMATTSASADQIPVTTLSSHGWTADSAMSNLLPC